MIASNRWATRGLVDESPKLWYDLHDIWGKDGGATMQKNSGPLTVKELGGKLSRQNFVVAMPCFFLGFLLSVLCWPPPHPRRLHWLMLCVCLGSVLLSFLLLCLCLSRFRRPITTSASGIHYYARQNRWLEQKVWFWGPLTLLLTGLALAVYQTFYGPLFLAYDRTFLRSLITVGLPSCLLLYRWLRRRLVRLTPTHIASDESLPEPYDRKHELRRAGVFWGIYWLLVLGAYAGLTIAFGNWRLYIFIPIIALCYFVARLLTNNPFRPYSSIRRQSVLLVLLNLIAVAALVIGVRNVISSGIGYSNRFISSLDYSVFRRDDPCPVDYDPQTGVYTITATRKDFKILQLTDVHIGESLTTMDTDRRALQACYDLIAQTQPDLIIVTGDVAYAIPAYTFSSNNLSALSTFMNFMDRVGIPWALTYGNHDNEPSSKYNDASAFNGLFRYYQDSGESAALYSPEVQPNIYGRYNQYLRVCDRDGSLNRVIFLVDSNDYTKGPDNSKAYDSVHSDQIQWYSRTIDQLRLEEGKTVPSFVFMHIPFPAFREAREALAAGDPAAQYLFGEDGEGVSCPKQDTGFFDRILEKGSTQAVFVGHDHLNNTAIRYQGVDLVYSKSIDFVAYPGIAAKTAQRGGTLITLRSGGEYRIEQVDYHEKSD